MPVGKGIATTARVLGIFKAAGGGSKPKGAAELVKAALEGVRELLGGRSSNSDKVRDDLERHLDEMLLKLYGDSEHHPVTDEVNTLTHEILQTGFFSLLVQAVPLLKESSRQPAAQIVAGVQSHARQAAEQYLKQHLDILDLMLKGYEDPDVALFYGSMLRDCVRHQEAARHVLYSPAFFSLFKFIEDPHFEISSDAVTTLKELLLRHKSTAAEFLLKHQQQFFSYYDKLLETSDYITKRSCAKLLADLLNDRAYSAVLEAYVADITNLRPVMNMLRESSKNMQLDGYNVFKIIVRHPQKSQEIAQVLAANKGKLKLVLQDIKLEKGSEAEMSAFESEKQKVLETIEAL